MTNGPFQSALAPIRHPTCVADVGSVVAARVQSAPLAAQEVNLGVPRPSTGSPQPALTKEATYTLEVTGLTNDPPIPVPAVAEKNAFFCSIYGDIIHAQVYRLPPVTYQRAVIKICGSCDYCCHQ